MKKSIRKALFYGAIVVLILSLVLGCVQWIRKGMKDEPMNIVFATNSSYIPHIATAITSIVENSDKNDSFKFYILESSLSPEDKKTLQEYVSNLGKNVITFVHINQDLFKKLPVYRKDLVSETYFRFFIPEVIPDSKALYLDGDVLVFKSLKEMYNTDVSNVYAGVVEDMSVKRCLEVGKEKGKEWLCHYKKIAGLKRYFNSGVLLLNLDKMRQNNMVDRLFQNTVILNKAGLLALEDQSVLNYTLFNDVLFLPGEYNEMLNDSSKVVIRHLFLGSRWRLKDKNHVYWKYRQKTPWKE